MELSAIYARLNTVFQNVFDEDDLVVTPATTADDVEGWDSLKHIRLMLSVEKEFKLHFSTIEINSLKNVGQLAELIQSKAA